MYRGYPGSYPRGTDHIRSHGLSPPLPLPQNFFLSCTCFYKKKQALPFFPRTSRVFLAPAAFPNVFLKSRQAAYPLAFPSCPAVSLRRTGSSKSLAYNCGKISPAPFGGRLHIRNQRERNRPLITALLYSALVEWCPPLLKNTRPGFASRKRQFWCLPTSVLLMPVTPENHTSHNCSKTGPCRSGGWSGLPAPASRFPHALQ